MTSHHVRDEMRLSKYLPVTSKCLAIVLAEKGNEGGENIGNTHEPTTRSNSVHNGKEIFEDFKLRNKTCYWNPALVESIKSLGYKGFVEPATILVVGNEIHLENLRTAWGRRVLKAPAGFNIERVGDVNGIEMQVIPQTQFIPLPDALCLIIMDLNNCRIVATLETVKEKLLEWYREMTMPSDQIIFDTLGNLIQERNVFHSGSGYFVVTPETYRLPSDDPNLSFNASWLPYHPMYIPVFPQIQSMPHQLKHVQHLQHFHQQEYHHRAPMRSISCQADMYNKTRPSGGVPGQTSADNKKAAVKPRPRSQSVRGPKSKEREKECDKAVVIDSEEALKRTMSVRYNNDKVKAIKDINLKTSNINKDKEKGEKEKISLFSKIFGRSKKKNVPLTTTVKEVEYATFSAQFPPPEWHWYQQQVEKQRRTEEWVSQQVSKSCTWQYLQNMAPAESTMYTESRAVLGTISQATKCRGSHVLQESNKCNRKGHGRRHGSKIKRDKTNANELKLKENQQMLYVTTNHDENIPEDSLSPVLAVDDEIYQSVVGSRALGPRHSTPRFYDTIPMRRDVKACPENCLNSQDILESVSCHPHNHFHKRSNRTRRKPHRNSLGYFDAQHQCDISFEYKGRMPTKNSVFAQSQDSGVNCIGLPGRGKNNEQQDCHMISGQLQDPVIVRNKLDNLEEENQAADQNHGNLNTTMVSEFQADLPPPVIYNNCYDSSMNDAAEGIHIVCKAEINHNPIQELAPRVGSNCTDVTEPVLNSGSRDALNSEKSYDTVVTVKKTEYENNENKNTEATIGEVRDLSLVDSGFSSPRNADNGGCEPSRQSSNTTDEFCNNRNCIVTKQYVKPQPQVPHNSPQEKCQLRIEHRHKHSSHMLNNQRHSHGYKCDSGDTGLATTAKDLQIFQKQQLSAKRFGLNGEFEVVGVV